MFSYKIRGTKEFVPRKSNELIPLDFTYSYSKELQHFLQGKQLLLDEIPFPQQIVHEHYHHGYIQYQIGIKKQHESFFCERCGNKEQRLFSQFKCARCNEVCAYCRKCIKMGRVSECNPLISWSGPLIERENETLLKWSGSLSEGQQKASQAVKRAIATKEELLVWAVCGSGKTEVLFKGLEYALKQNLSACITTPRTDVVHELTPRLKSVFPNTDISSLYGGSEDRGKSAQLVLSTTHQLLRYKNWFDCIIIDEVDAFPYSTDQMLQYAVKQAKKKESATIYLTATPSKEWKKLVRKKELPVITIPARYHRNPLPVPQFKWCGNWKKQLYQKTLSHTVKSWIYQRLQQQKQAFLFVPKIDLLDNIVTILQQLDHRTEGVHAEDSLRKEKVELFRNGDILILVTTTILERGVTVPNVDVAVLGAEDEIFTESALVQISGRVGRSAAYPSGEVTFFHYGKTKAMIEAKRHIEQMNKEALEKGLIDPINRRKFLK